MNAMMSNYYTQPQRYMQPQQNGIIWVQGIEGAKAYQMIPNSNVILLDSEIDGRFYIKVSDNVGMCTLRTFKFEEITNAVKSTEDLTQYVTRNELKQVIEDLKGALLNGKQSIPATEQSIDATKPTIITE